MFKSSWTIARIRGIPMRLHVSLLFIVPLIALSLTRTHVPMRLHEMGLTTANLSLPPVVWGVLLSLFIFVGVALHELGHALVALRQGGRVRAITLMLMGGIAEIDHENATPRQQAWMAFAGPLVSLLLAAAAFGLMFVPWPVPDAWLALSLFGEVNLALAIFNLVPAYPLDGGRILRALLAMKLDGLKATRAAAFIGRGFALLGLGLAMYTKDPMLFLVAAFVYFGAGVEEAAMAMRSQLVGVRARQAMVTRAVTVEPTRPLASVARHMLFHGAAAAVVRDVDGLYGVLLPRDLRGKTDARGALRGEPLVVSDGDDLGEVARRLQRSGQGGAIVLDDFNTIVGVVTHEELHRALALKAAAEAGLVPPGSQPVEAPSDTHLR